MAISQNLALKQGQSLVMTPQLQQAIKLLQLSNVELSEYIETELEKNPLLERDDAPAEPRAAAEANAEPSSEVPAPELAPLDDNRGAMGEMDDTWQGRDDTADAQVGASVAFENWGSGGSRSLKGAKILTWKTAWLLKNPCAITSSVRSTLSSTILRIG